MSSTLLSLFCHLVLSTHIEGKHSRKNTLSCLMKTELNLMIGIYGEESAAPRGACLAGILHSRGCASLCDASPRAIAPSAPPARKTKGKWH